MRKSRSLPAIGRRNEQAPKRRAPLCAPSRPANNTPRWRSTRDAGFSQYHRPSVRWELTHEKLAGSKQFQDEATWARDSYDMHRPLGQRLERPRPPPFWRGTEVGNKLSFGSAEDSLREAALSRWDLYRPVNIGEPPWEEHPRAQYVTAIGMPPSMVQ